MADAAGALPTEERRDQDPHALGTAIALSGAALGIVAAGLSLLDPESHRRAHPGEPVDDQLLVQSLPGLSLLGAAIACAVSVFFAFRGRRMTWGPMIAGIAAIPLVVLAALRGILAAHFGASHGHPGPGLGVYAGLVAGVLMFVGGLLIRRWPRIETLVVGSAAGALVATCVWWLTGLSEPAPPDIAQEAPGP